jgi:signal transduction histidine kinase
VNSPIQVPDSSGSEYTFVGQDVEDASNDECWGLVVHQSIEGHGVLQVATEGAVPADAELVQRLELFGRYFAAVLARLERQELTMFNRILRHETVNGLALVQARLAMLEEDISAENRDHYETAATRVDNLIEQVEAIRTIRSDAPVDTGARPLAPVVNERVTGASQRYPDATFTVVESVSGVDVAVDDLLDLCLRNVLRNAVQHADAGEPEVQVRVESDHADACARVSVADNGPGIPDVDGSVFDFGVTGRDRSVGGEGAGLFLTRRIIEGRYGGRVGADESDLGGAEFVIELPLAGQ